MSLVAALVEREIGNGRPSQFLRSNLARHDYVHRMKHSLALKGHNGCVNTMQWNEAGTKLISGSDDQHIILWSEGGQLLKDVLTAHTNNVFSALFLPSATTSENRLAVSAAGDGLVLLHDLEYAASDRRGDAALGNAQRPSEHIQQWDCQSRVKRMAVASAHPKLFWSASEDGVLRQFDVRTKFVERLIDFSSSDFLSSFPPRVQLKSLAINQARPEMLAVAMNDSMVPVYDRRYTAQPMLRLLPAHLSFAAPDSAVGNADRDAGRPPFSLHSRSALVTHLAFNSRGDELLANIGSDNIYVFNIDASQSHSPNVFNALQSFFDVREEGSEEKGAKAESGKPIFREVIRASEAYARGKELSRAIDLCSNAYSLYRRSNGLSRSVPFTHNNNDEQGAAKVVGDLSKLLTSRATYYLERQWEGDSYAALRDLIQAHQLSKSKPAQRARIHLHICRALAKLKQLELATKCRELYTRLYQTPEDAERLKTLELDSKDLHRHLYLHGHESTHNRSWTGTGGYVDYVDRFCGHCNTNTDIKEANWFGGNDELIVAGSDCGNMFVWERESGKVVKLLKADHYTVNCVQPHPLRFLVASSGIEDVIRLYEPASTSFKSRGSNDDQERDLSSKIYEVMEANRRHTSDNLLLDHLNRWGNFVFSTLGLEIPPAPPNNNNNDGADEEGPGVEEAVRCRTM